MFKKKIFSTLSAAMMIVMVGASLLPTLTALAVTNTRSEDLIFQKDSTGNVVAILSKNGLVTPIGNVQVIRDINGNPTGIKTIYGETIAISGGSYTLPVASSSVLGGIKPDGTTIIVNGNGVASASGVGGGSGTVTGVTCSGTSGVTCTSNGSSTAPVLSVGVSGPVPSATIAATASAVPATGITGLGSGVPLTTTVNTANGLVKLDGSAKLPAIDISNGTGLTTSQVQNAGVLAISGTVATNDTFVAASSTVMTPVHHAAGNVYTVAHTFTATDINTTNPNEYASSVAASGTVDTAANVPAVTGDTICVKQTSTGAMAIVGASGVTVDAESGKHTTNGQYAGVCAQNVGTDHWWLFGNRI